MDFGSRHPNIAYLYALLGNGLFTVNEILFKVLSDVMTPFQVLFVRSICMFLINTQVLRYIGESPYIRSAEGKFVKR